MTGPETWIRKDLETDRGILTTFVCDPCECPDKPAGPFSRATSWPSIHPDCCKVFGCLHFVNHTIRLTDSEKTA